MQTKVESAVETVLNVLSGFLVSWAVYEWVLPLWGVRLPTVDSFQVAVLFTFLSIGRAYAWRRLFNRRTKC